MYPYVRKPFPQIKIYHYTLCVTETGVLSRGRRSKVNHVEPCHPSQRYRVTAAPPFCSTEHTCGPTLQTDHIRPSSIFCCGSHSVEQSSCRIQRPDNQRCLLSTAFKDSSVRTTASAPWRLARARFVYDYALYKFSFIITVAVVIIITVGGRRVSVAATRPWRRGQTWALTTTPTL